MSRQTAARDSALWRKWRATIEEDSHYSFAVALCAAARHAQNRSPSQIYRLDHLVPRRVDVLRRFSCPGWEHKQTGW